MDTAQTDAPKISCIVTAYNEKALASVALTSLLGQSFTDFEILVVDDGADEQTRQIVQSFDDPRIRHIRQANDGPSSARNRALNNARGEYVCFLDADDTRPPWALAELAAATEGEPDCVFAPGTLVELRNDPLPFYDQTCFDSLQAYNLTAQTTQDKTFTKALRWLFCIEPQSANKLMRRAFLDAHEIRFPNGISFFEDANFHMLVLLNLNSYKVVNMPCFTYYRRYGEKRLTDSRNYARYDALTSVANVMHVFAQSRYYHDPISRFLVTAATFRVLRWGLDSVSADLKHSYSNALKLLLVNMDSRILATVPGDTWQELQHYAPWVENTLRFVQTLKNT